MEIEEEEIIEIEEYDETEGIKADPFVLECLKNTLIYHLRENPRDYDVPFIQESYHILKKNSVEKIEWLDNLMLNENKRNRLIIGREKRRC